MGDEPKKRSRAWIGWMIVLLPALYVLSSGPAGWLWSRGYLKSEPWNVVYAPLDWAYEHSTAVQQFADWYMRLWMPPGR